MKSLRRLRYLILACLFSFLAYLYFSYEWRANESPPPSFDLQTGTSVTVGNQIVSKNLTLQSQRAISYETGRTVFEDFLLKVDKGGRLITISGEKAEVQQQEEIERVVMRGGVRLESSDGIVLTGEGLIYRAHGSLVRSDSPVSFFKRNIQGEAHRLIYQLEPDILELRGAVKIFVSPAEERRGEPPITIESDYLRYDRRRDFVWLRNNVTITRPPDYLKTKELFAFFDPLDKQLIRMELMGGVFSFFGAGEPEGEQTGSSSPNEGTGGLSFKTAVAGRKTLFCQRMRLFFHPGEDNRIKSILAYNRAQLKLFPSYSSSSKIEEVRTITAKRFEIGLTPDGREMEEFNAFENVHARLFLPPTVAPSPPKDIYCEELYMKLDPNLGEIVSAEFKENVRYIAGEFQIVCEAGNYNPKEELITLSGSPVITEGQDKVTAEEVALHLQEETMVAKGKVVSQFASKGSKGGRLGGELFALSKGEEPVIFNSNCMIFNKNKGIITFTGGVKAFQGSNIIWADKIVIHQEEGLLKAGGEVKSILPQSSSPSEEAGEEEVPSGGLLEIISSAMVYRKPAGRIRYFNGVTVNKKGLSITADKLDLILDQKGEDVVEGVAQGGVKVRQGTKVAEGDHGVYDFRKEKLTLTGKEVRFVEEGVMSYRGNILTIFLKDDKMILSARKDGRVESKQQTPRKKR